MSQETALESSPSTTVSLGRLVLVGFIFCISGVSALVYQVAWQRILAFHSGVGIYSVAVIVAAFLAGLGLGSYWGGILSRRASQVVALRVFAALELGVGLFAVWSCSLYYDLLYLETPWLYASLWRAVIFHFLALIVPTTLMGMSLPFLVQAMVRDAEKASRTIGYLYGINVLGAALGALLAPWLLIRFFGIQGAVHIGAAGNFLAGLTALALGLFSSPPGERPGAARSEGPPHDAEPAGSRPFVLWVGLYTLSGFCALSLEILWFRVVDVAVKSTAFTFGTVLAIYLLGLGVGSLVGGPLAIRLKRPLKAFLLCQCALLIYAGAAAFLLVSLPTEWSFYRDLLAYWQQYDEFQFGLEWDWSRILSLYLALPVFLYGPPTVLMGLSFGILQRAVHDDVKTTGFKVGILQSGNIVGNVAGSLLAGLFFLNFVGTTGTLRLLILLGLAFALVGARYYGARSSFGVLGAAMLGVLILLPGGNDFWLRLHGLTRGPAMFDEDASAVGAITPDGPRLRVSINGKGHSTLPFGGIHSRLGTLPALIHPAPREVAIIGLGSGDTAWSAGCRRETERITVFEIIAPIERLLTRRLLTRIDPQLVPRLRGFLEDPRLEIVVADGRNTLALDDKKYDLVEADALRPHSAFSGNLYSVEFFRLCSRKLKPGGMMCTWSPTPRIYVGFCEVFPHVLELNGGQILVGSNEPLDVRLEEWTERLQSPEIRDYLGPHVSAEVMRALATVRPANTRFYKRFQANRDLSPRDEFRSPYTRDLKRAWRRQTDTGYVGTWQRELERGYSSLTFERREGGYRARWSKIDGTRTVRCDDDGNCEEYYADLKIYEWRLRAFSRPGSDDLFLEVTGTPLDDSTPALNYTDRLVVEGGGLELWSYQIEENGVEKDPPEDPLKFRKISDEPL